MRHGYAGVPGSIISGWLPGPDSDEQAAGLAAGPASDEHAAGGLVDDLGRTRGTRQGGRNE
jgi:hypothetical protein